MKPEVPSLGFLLAGLAMLLLRRLFTAACSARQSLLRSEGYSNKERKVAHRYVATIGLVFVIWAYSNYSELSRLGERADQSSAGTLEQFLTAAGLGGE